MRKPPVCASKRASGCEQENARASIGNSWTPSSSQAWLPIWPARISPAPVPEWSASVTVHSEPWIEPESFGRENPLGETRCPGTRLESGVSFTHLLGVGQARVSEQNSHRVPREAGRLECKAAGEIALLSPSFWPQLVRCQAALFSAQEVGKGSA